MLCAGAWGKRDPAWHNLKGLWGKRSPLTDSNESNTSDIPGESDKYKYVLPKNR